MGDLLPRGINTSAIAADLLPLQNCHRGNKIYPGFPAGSDLEAENISNFTLKIKIIIITFKIKIIITLKIKVIIFTLKIKIHFYHHHDVVTQCCKYVDRCWQCPIIIYSNVGR